jgi:hypothetical protein
MIQPSAFRLSPADLPGPCRRTRCPAASYTTQGDTILKFAVNLNVVSRADKPQRRVARKFNSLLACGSGQSLHRAPQVGGGRRARRIAQPPKAAFVTRLQPCRLPGRAARHLPDQSTTLWVDSSSTSDPRLRGALPKGDIAPAFPTTSQPQNNPITKPQNHIAFSAACCELARS